MASETVNISTEYLAWDNIEAVYVTYHEDGKERPRKTISYALRVMPADKRSSYQGMRTSARETSYWLPIAEFGSDEPDGNMVLERASNGEKYSLLESKKVEYGTSESHWDCLMTRYQDEC